MALVDVEAMNASLANDYGPDRGTSAADWHDLELWYGDPRLDGSEALDTAETGAWPRIMPADWSTPDGGAIQAVKSFAEATVEWSLPATHWLLRGSDGFAWDADALTEPLVVTGAGLIPPVTVTVYHADLQEDDDE
jgi:hypothetical protein